MTRPPVSPLSAMSDSNEPSANDLLVGELTAALLHGQQTPDDVLPPALASRITQTGEALVRARGVPPIPVDRSAPVSPFRRGVAWSGWLAAAALLLVVARRDGRLADRPTDGAQTAMAPTAPVDLGVALRDSLLAADSALVRVAWTPTSDPTASGVTGEVLWSARAQRGVMRFAGLAPNDQRRSQYQLWIFDKQRDQRYPVDGGVFDIPAGQTEVLVPIQARIPVGEAVMFAVTVEQAGGVVVSNRERIAVVASL